MSQSSSTRFKHAQQHPVSISSINLDRQQGEKNKLLFEIPHKGLLKISVILRLTFQGYKNYRNPSIHLFQGILYYPCFYSSLNDNKQRNSGIFRIKIILAIIRGKHQFKQSFLPSHDFEFVEFCLIFQNSNSSILWP